MKLPPLLCGFIAAAIATVTVAGSVNTFGSARYTSLARTPPSARQNADNTQVHHFISGQNGLTGTSVVWVVLIVIAVVVIGLLILPGIGGHKYGHKYGHGGYGGYGNGYGYGGHHDYSYYR